MDKCKMKFKGRRYINLLVWTCVNPDHDHGRVRFGLNQDSVLIDATLLYESMTRSL